MRLYDEAIEVINLSIDNDIAIKDTTGLLYDLEFSGALHFHKGIYKTADSLFVKTIELAGGKNDIITARQIMYRAAIRYKNNEIDSAVCMIRTVPERVTDAYHSLALAYACDIYLKAGLLDSALFYALELKNLHDEYNAKAAYRTLLSPEIAKSLNQDSVLKYAGEYGTVLENFMDRNGDRAALIQSSLFNYEKQLREKEKALKAKQTRNYIIIAIALTAALIFILFLKNKNRNNELRLLKAENSLRKLKDSIEHLKQNSSYLYNDKICPENAEKSSTVNEKDISRRIENPEIDEARIRLREEILSTLKDVRHVGSVNPVILNSDIYAKLKELLSIKKPMSTYKDAESELYKLFHVNFKDFQFSLNLLTDNQMTPVDWETAMLIKCGFSATEISILSAKSSGAISSRRASLSLKIFGTKIGNVKLDNAIRLL